MTIQKPNKKEQVMLSGKTLQRRSESLTYRAKNLIRDISEGELALARRQQDIKRVENTIKSMDQNSPEYKDQVIGHKIILKDLQNDLKIIKTNLKDRKQELQDLLKYWGATLCQDSLWGKEDEDGTDR